MSWNRATCGGTPLAQNSATALRASWTNTTASQGSFFYSGYLGSPVQRLRTELSSETEAAALEAQEKGLGAVGYDPEVRVKFQVEAGIDAEVMNPTTMLGVMRNPDVPVLHACSEVFNDWMSEFSSYAPGRLVGISVIPMYDIEWAVEELNRTLSRGLKGPMINCQAPDGRPPYRDPVYDKFWAAAEEAGVPITLHILTGRVLDALILARTGQTAEETAANPGLWDRPVRRNTDGPGQRLYLWWHTGPLSQPESALQRV